MRITSQMLIDTVGYDIANSLSRYARTETMLSSGKRITAPSDDPIGTQHDLTLRTRQSAIAQYMSNISQSNGWMAAYDTGLGDLKDIYSSAKEVAISMANDTYDATAREAAAEEVESLFEQVLQIANGSVDGRQLYSGFRTRTKPLEASANGVIYQGDRGVINLDIDFASQIVSNLNGADLFFKQVSTLGSDADLDVGMTGATRLTDLHLGEGVDLASGTIQVFDANRNLTYTVDVSGAVTAADVVTAVNAQLGAAGNMSLAVNGTGASFRWIPVVGATNTVTDTTPLSNLNSGTGVQRQPGTILIRNDSGTISFEASIGSATTLGEVRTAINDALTAQGITGVTVGFNSSGTGLAVTDSNAVSLGLTIEDVSEQSTAAADLGISGRVDGVLEGRDLRPQAEFVITEGGGTAGHDLGLLGTFKFETAGEELEPRLMLDTPLSQLNNNSGFALGRIKISQGDQVAFVDLGNSTIVTVADAISAINSCGLAITAEVNTAGTGLQIRPTVDDRTLIIENADDGQTASDLGIIGSPDMLGSMMLLITALHNDDRAMAEKLNGNLDKAMDELLSSRAAVGAKVIRMDASLNRLEAADVETAKLLSEVEDADITALITQLSKEQNLYQAALLAGARAIQPSLLDFLD
ncbi:MAG: flagellar hook-associated protein FlgL [candidate division Zixibacteria bacterium]|nr:flagellar hook-associated protein FlgL [candidate division Zixibacteria bacterium]